MPISIDQSTVYHLLAAMEWRLFFRAFIFFFKIKDIKNNS